MCRLDFSQGILRPPLHHIDFTQEDPARVNVWAQFNGLLRVRRRFVELSHAELGLGEPLPTISTEGIQLNGSVIQSKSFVKAATHRCRRRRQSDAFEIPRFSSDRPLE